ncbi:MAG: hypothetical protein A2W25_05995 [candidate division Zixibacteria bacterium RBG_16_53_22]|nr:MAG: hypothetical protein A2W25_05995 [candidate division Zixibacteria bacterium RBG_16_53_22]
MNSSRGNEIPVLMLSVAALIAAVFISLFTMTSHDRVEAAAASRDPYQMASAAARAGVEAATWHIQCHGRVVQGGIGRKYYINGASFEASWGEVNLSDSTVTIQSSGISQLGNNQEYTLNIETRVKLQFLPVHKNEILTDYYSRSVSAMASSE